jgi:glyoxylase-like metal-dependent hydrolase (beta-lactamase superfamily II)
MDMDTTPANVNRRSLLTGSLALAGAAGSGLLGSTSLVLAQEAATTGIDRPRWRPITLGDFKVVTYLDGSRAGDGPHPTFGADQPAEAVEELLGENFLPPRQFVNFFTPTLVDTGAERILFDTGLGAGARPDMGRLTELLAASGYQPSDISIVVLTHFHGDHIGGLMEDGEPAFPNARYVAPTAEYDYWTKAADAEAAQPVTTNVVPFAEQMTFIGDGDSVVSGITAIAAHGHTPGHTIFNLESGGQRLVLTADTANHYVASLQKPEWEVRFDMDKTAAAETRKTVFGMLAADKVPFIGYHMPFPAIGFVEPVNGGFRYVPASYQFDV